MEQEHTAGASGSGITVTGSGTASAIPDVFVLEIAAEAQSGSVAEALRQASEALHRIRAAALEHGVEPGQLTSQSMSVTQRYNELSFDCLLPMTVRSTNLERAGDLVVACTEAGGDRTRLLGTSLDHSDRLDLLTAARDAAFADALERAGQFAALAGRELGPVQQVLEGMPAWGHRSGSRGVMMAMADSAPPVDPGSLDVTAAVTVAWAWA